MTFEILKKIIEKHNIQENVTLLQDCGWECGATVMDGVWYNAKRNEIQFTQDGKFLWRDNREELDEPHDRTDAENKDDWKLLYFHDHWGTAGKTELDEEDDA